MIVEQNKLINHTGDNVSLRILANGIALCDTDWCATEPSPPYTRLYYILEGEAVIKTEEGELPLRAGTVYLLPTGHPFSYWCDTRMRQLYFHVQLTGHEGGDLLRGIHHALQMPLANDYLQQLLALQQSLSTTDHWHLKALLTRDIFALLTENDLTLKEVRYSDGIAAALRFVEEHLSVTLTVNEVAEAVFISPYTLARKFKAEVGLSLGQYIDGLVLFKAKQLLQDTDLSLSHISETLGFCDQFYFSRCFRKHFSVPPLKYRQRHR